MRNKATESIKASKREYFTSAVNDNKDNPKAMRKTMKKLLPSKKAKIPGSIDYQITKNDLILNSTPENRL